MCGGNLCVLRQSADFPPLPISADTVRISCELTDSQLLWGVLCGGGEFIVLVVASVFIIKE